MSINWYSSWTGESNDNNFINNYHSRNFIDNRGGFNPGYGAAGNNGNIRRNYESRSGKGASSNCREKYSGNFSGGYGQRHRDNDRYGYGENARSNNRASYSDNSGEGVSSNCREKNSGNFSGGYEQRYRDNDRYGYGENAISNNRAIYSDNSGEGASSNCREKYSGTFSGGYEQRHRDNDRSGYGENARSNNRASYSDNFPRGFQPRFGDNVRDNHCGINYTGNNKKTYYGHERRTDSDWPGHSYSKDSAGGSDKQYQDIKGESERIKPKIKEEYFEKDMKNEDLRIKQEIKLEDCTQKVIGEGFKDNGDIHVGLIIKTEIDIEQNKEIRCNLERLKEMSSQERVQNYVTDQIKEEAFSDINLKKEILIKREMTGENIFENNEKHPPMTIQDQRELKSCVLSNIAKDEVANFAKKLKKEFKKRKQKEKKKQNKVKENNRTNQEKKDRQRKRKKEQKKKKNRKLVQYACLKLDCQETFKVWKTARKHMQQGCFTIKPMLHKSRQKAVMLNRVAVENEKSFVDMLVDHYSTPQ